MKVLGSAYTPKQLEGILKIYNLNDCTITRIESPSYVYGSNKNEVYNEENKEYELSYVDATLDLDVIITFAENKKIGVWFCSASHVVILPYKFDFKIKDVDYGTDDITVSDIFNEVVGKTIKSYEIHKTDKLDKIRESLAWEDAGFDEKQEEFITGLDFILRTKADYVLGMILILCNVFMKHNITDAENIELIIVIIIDYD